MKLDKEMGEVNWCNHPGNWFYEQDDPNDAELATMRKLEKKLDQVFLIDEPDSQYAWEYLLVKHFRGTALEATLKESVPYLAESFNATLIEEQIHSEIESEQRRTTGRKRI